MHYDITSTLKINNVLIVKSSALNHMFPYFITIKVKRLAKLPKTLFIRLENDTTRLSFFFHFHWALTVSFTPLEKLWHNLTFKYF